MIFHTGKESEVKTERPSTETSGDHYKHMMTSSYTRKSNVQHIQWVKAFKSAVDSQIKLDIASHVAYTKSAKPKKNISKKPSSQQQQQQKKKQQQSDSDSSVDESVMTRLVDLIEEEELAARRLRCPELNKTNLKNGVVLIRKFKYEPGPGWARGVVKAHKKNKNSNCEVKFELDSGKRNMLLMRNEYYVGMDLDNLAPVGAWFLCCTGKRS